MSRRLSRTLVLPVTVAALLAGSAPGIAGAVPRRGQAEPGQTQPGHAVGGAGAALGVLRLLPSAVPTSSILPGVADQPSKSALEAGVAVSTARADSESAHDYERAIAQSAPAAVTLAGDVLKTPGSLAQTALPDNPQPLAGGLTAPQNSLLNVGVLSGSVRARWSPTLGPCVGTIADARTSVASLALLDTIPTLPNLPIDKLANLPQLASGFDPAKGLQTLGGLLTGAAQTATDGTGTLLSLPNTFSSRSVVQLVDLPDSPNKAVQSESTLQAADIEILKGTPLALTLKMVSQPTLRVTSTGDQSTSKVEYRTPVITIERQGQVLYTLDAAHPTKDIPIGLPLKALTDQLGTAVQSLPVVGGLVATVNQGLQQLTDTSGTVLDLGVLRLSIAELNEKGQRSANPFDGYQLSASARLLDLQVLPTSALKNLLPGSSLPSSLAQLSLGEQVGRAYAPTGGVVCRDSAPPAGNAAPGAPEQLAYTEGAYSAIPLFWAGTTMLLVGAILVAALPARRRVAPVKPSPRPRS
ncbi:MAG TPA: hypothetical protein VJT49_09450 [Amycolatopsis sp.]|uniref:hypothetical protein n=1 Tax=Amycolatopsis sp. TaxID=37632 RepID=UPI002B49DB08|nr:hypothetical protein [Amycolatopsis sp.]HKS45323.1 hypothetical protein [Amycolatopsis sp.]